MTTPNDAPTGRAAMPDTTAHPAARPASRGGAAGCSPTPMPRTLFWGQILAFVAALTASGVGMFVAPSTSLWWVTVLSYAAAAISVLAVGAWAAYPELFRRNR